MVYLGSTDEKFNEPEHIIFNFLITWEDVESPKFSRGQLENEAERGETYSVHFPVSA